MKNPERYPVSAASTVCSEKKSFSYPSGMKIGSVISCASGGMISSAPSTKPNACALRTAFPAVASLPLLRFRLSPISSTAFLIDLVGRLDGIDLFRPRRDFPAMRAFCNMSKKYSDPNSTVPPTDPCICSSAIVGMAGAGDPDSFAACAWSR